MKLTRITEENIGLIRFRIEQFVKRMVYIQSQSFYATAKLYESLNIPNKIGDYNFRHVVQSQLSHFNPKKVELDRDFSTNIPYIRFVLNTECAELIKIGDKIKITPTNIFIKENGSIINTLNGFPKKSPFSIISKGDKYEALWREQRDIEQAREYEEFYDDIAF